MAAGVNGGVTSTVSVVSLPALVRADPTLRGLLWVTLINTLGRGAFFTLTTLYLTLIVGMTPVEVGIGLTVAGAVGVCSSLAFGHLADRFRARVMLTALHVVQGCALIGYLLVRDLPSLIVVASLVMLAVYGGNSVRSAVIGRAFVGEDRVRIRAAMRTVANVGIGAGTAAAAIPLALGTPFAFQVTMGVAGSLFLVSALLVRLLDAGRVEAAPADRPRDAGSLRGPSPYRDARYLWLTVLMGAFGIQFGVFEIAVPLWVVGHTTAPDVLVSPLLLLNTVVVVLLQVRMSRGTGTPRGAGRAMKRAGWLMVAACALWAVAGAIGGDGWIPVAVAVTLLLAAAFVHSLAEIASSAAGWSLSFDLAPPERVGGYQGVYGTGSAVGVMLAPAVVTLTAIDLGALGWAILAGLFAVSAAGVALIARRSAAETRD